MTTLFRARWLAPVLSLVLMACSAADREARLKAQADAIDPPALWRVEVVDAGGAPAAALLVCANGDLVDGFRRANAEVSGELCLTLDGAVDRPGLYASRCVLNGRRFSVSVAQSGDPERDFTAAFAMTALDGSGLGARQVRRFRRIGPCPEGWRIGDQAPPGGPPGVNALAGAWSGE
jgi:hypothetical protein